MEIFSLSPSLDQEDQRFNSNSGMILAPEDKLESCSAGQSIIKEILREEVEIIDSGSNRKRSIPEPSESTRSPTMITKVDQPSENSLNGKVAFIKFSFPICLHFHLREIFDRTTVQKNT